MDDEKRIRASTTVDTPESEIQGKPQMTRSSSFFRRKGSLIEPKPSNQISEEQNSQKFSFLKFLKFGSDKSALKDKDDRARKSRTNIVAISSVEELPKEEQQLIIGMNKEALNQNLEIVCNILTFLGDNRVMTQIKHQQYLAEKEKQQQIKNQEQSETPKEEQGEPETQDNNQKSLGENQKEDKEDEEIEREIKNEENNQNDSEFSIKNLLRVGKTEITERDPKKILKILGRSGKGGFGTVFQVKDKKGNLFAMKRMPHDSLKQKRSNLKEIGALKLFKHPNIVEYFSAYSWKNEIVLVMEYLEGGTLSEAVQLNTFTEAQVAYVSREMLKALEFLHDKHLIHRDLKSSNVMMSVSAQIKLIDFGLLSESSSGKQTRCGGSPYWMSPEMIKMVGYDTKNDIWNYAMCVLELAKIYHQGSNFKVMFTVATVGWNPFQDKSLKSGQEPVNEKEQESSKAPPKSKKNEAQSLESKASEEFQDFISRCLVLNSEERWTATQLLAHPFLLKAAEVNDMQSVLQSVFLHNALKVFG